MARRVIRHNRKILNEHYLPNKIGLRPGMILRFNYREKTAFDKIPLIFYLYRDREKQMIHGINMNYLTNNEVNRMFMVISQKIDITLVEKHDTDNDLNSPYSFVKLKNKGAIAKSEREELYNNTIKVFLRKRKLDAYRTYYFKSMANVKVIHYKF